MRAFEYASPATKDQAVQLLGKAWDDAAPLAGGTDLLALMKDDVFSPKRLVNIKELKELRGIVAGPRQLRIGALTTHPGSTNFFLNRMPAVLWVLAIGSYWTFAHRMYHTWIELNRSKREAAQSELSSANGAEQHPGERRPEATLAAKTG